MSSFREGANNFRMKQKKHVNETAKQLRDLLKNLARAKLKTKNDKLRVAKQTGIAVASIDSMLYHQKGGLDAWATLLTKIYDISPVQLAVIFTEVKQFLREKHKLSKGQLLWSAHPQFWALSWPVAVMERTSMSNGIMRIK